VKTQGLFLLEKDMEKYMHCLACFKADTQQNLEVSLNDDNTLLIVRCATHPESLMVGSFKVALSGPQSEIVQNCAECGQPFGTHQH
jgi:hypothetical protein